MFSETNYKHSPSNRLEGLSLVFAKIMSKYWNNLKS